MAPTIAPETDLATYFEQLNDLPVFQHINGAPLAPLQIAYQNYLAQPLQPPPLPSVKQVLLFAPIYLNDVCPNECVYCGFRKSNKFKRTLLTTDESVQQAQWLATQGHETVDLVTGETPIDVYIDRVVTTIERILRETGIKKVNLNLGALTSAHYQRLAAAGASGYNIYQETYDTDSYFAMHQAGQKRNMPYRLAAPERALRAGFKTLGMAALLGLGPYESDVPKLILHAQYLKAQFPSIKIGFSLPRLQSFEADQGFKVPHPMADDIYMKTVCFIRQQCPDASITISTRESAAIRDQLVAWGLVDKISAGVSTKPGGYGHLHDEALEQFHISDERSLSEIQTAVAASGLPVVTH